MIPAALLLGIIEGLTEFLPVSSTGHLILAGHLLGFTGPKAAVFEIVIQLGAILAVVWEYRRPLVATALGVLAGPRRSPASWGLAMNVALAFLPAAAAGLLFHGMIEAHLFGPSTVAGALVAGGLAMLAIERRHPAPRATDVMAIPSRQAVWIGLAQVLSLFPGVSRAAATIMGGMLAGLGRRAATEFSFFLAIPTLGAATLFGLLKSWDLLSGEDLALMGIGFAAAFVSALLAVRVFIRYVSHHDFRPFAWYRIALGFVVLAFFRP